MIVRVINLDREPDRLARFTETNRHLTAIERFPAVDGRTLDIERLLRAGTIEESILDSYTIGALGNALSHLGLWAEAVENNAVMTVAEDDAVLNRHFERQAAALIARLPADWDIVLWGWNLDAPMVAYVIPGVATAVIFANEEMMNRNVAVFQEQAIEPGPLKLMLAFGVLGYSISPKGARALRDFCLPIREMWRLIPYPELGADKITIKFKASVPNRGTSIMMSAAYPQLRAFVSMPPLALSPNSHAGSTVAQGMTLRARLQQQTRGTR